MLITGKRSASVRCVLTSIIFYIHKQELLSILDQNPMQEKILLAIAEQRINNKPEAKPRYLDKAIEYLKGSSEKSVFNTAYAEKLQALKRFDIDSKD